MLSITTVFKGASAEFVATPAMLSNTLNPLISAPNDAYAPSKCTDT